MATTVLIADDDPSFRGVVKRLLTRVPDLHLLGEANDGEEVLELVRRVPPDVVLMDIAMPRLNGLVATRQIKAERPQTKVIVLTANTEEEYRRAAAASGADAFLAKKSLLGELLPAIRSVVGRESG